MALKVWFIGTRPQFLILTVVLAFLGTSIAWYNGFFHFGYAVLAFFGLLLAHISVNTLNDYFDYKSGVDLAVKRTPFSGGSGVLPAGLLKPGQMLRFSLIALLLAAAIGVYFVVVRGWLLLPLLVVAGLCILLYTSVILKHRWPEWAAGLGLGTLPVMGAYFVQASGYSWLLVVAAIPSGILVYNLLFLNEFPDTEADKVAKRKTTPITAGKAKASKIFAVMTAVVYLWIIGGVITGMMPVFSLIALLTVPLAVKAIRGALRYEEMSQLMPAMASNVMVVLLTQLLLGVGYILATVFPSGVS
ncbi:MAG: prenyltransferase [Chloroflexi bacterium]|nr:prenyltransferase [Chloroflexota bacterium]